jgi:hypothetical protein
MTGADLCHGINLKSLVFVTKLLESEQIGLDVQREALKFRSGGDDDCLV